MPQRCSAKGSRGAGSKGAWSIPPRFAELLRRSGQQNRQGVGLGLPAVFFFCCSHALLGGAGLGWAGWAGLGWAGLGWGELGQVGLVVLVVLGWAGLG